MMSKGFMFDQKDSLDSYFQELPKFPLINHQEVTRHAQEIEKGKNLIYEALIQFSFVRDHLLEMIKVLEKDKIRRENLFGPLAFSKLESNGKGPNEREMVLVRQIESLCRAADRQDPTAGKRLAKIGLASTLLNRLLAEVETRANPLRARLAESERKIGLKEISPRSLQGWLASRANGNGLSVKKFLGLADQIDQGQKIRDAAGKRLTEANLRLPVWVAKRYNGNHLEFLDLIQEGNLGLIKATERFDWRQEYRFPIYATWWIRQEISRSIYNQDRTIRRPVGQEQKAVKIASVSRRLVQGLQREPHPEEIAKEIKWPVGEIKDILELVKEPTSLDQPIPDKNGEDGDSRHDQIPDQRATNPEKSAWLALFHQAIDEILNSGDFTTREVITLRLYFGFEDGICYSSKGIERITGLGRETVRQSHQRALLKLRVDYQNQLAPYFQTLFKD